MNSSKDVRQSRSRPSRLSCPKWGCLLLRIVLQDAFNEVTQIHPPLKLRVFVDDITALLMGKNKVVAEMARKVLKKLEEEVQRNVLKLSVTEDGKEGKSKMIASCGFLENELLQCSKEEGVTLADSVETLRSRLENESDEKALSERKSEKKDVQNQVFACKKHKAFQQNYMKPVSRSCYERVWY